MQKVVYECYQCGANTSAKGKHISLRFAINSGIAIPPVKNNKFQKSFWTISPKLDNKFVHFCGVKCLSEYFRKLISLK